MPPRPSAACDEGRSPCQPPPAAPAMHHCGTQKNSVPVNMRLLAALRPSRVPRAFEGPTRRGVDCQVPEGRKTMADPTQPTSPIDLRKLMADFDAGKLMGEFQNMLKQYNVPGVDMEAVAASQKKNIEAVTAANRAAVEGLQTLARRQTEVLQETMRETSQAVAAMSKSASPSDVVAKQAELMRSAFEKGVTTMREMADIVSKSNREATDAINARIIATLDEIRGLALKK